MAFSKKKIVKILLATLLVLLVVFQIRKRNDQKLKSQQQEKALNLSEYPIRKVLRQLPIYRDSVYKVYIIKINSENKIVFLKKGNLTERQKESSFFVHIYPKNKNKLEKGLSHIHNNFKNNVTSFLYNNEEYFISETNLPNIKISKLNLGQFGFRGDNSVSWKTSNLLIDQKIGNILKENNENVPLFAFTNDMF